MLKGKLLLLLVKRCRHPQKLQHLSQLQHCKRSRSRQLQRHLLLLSLLRLIQSFRILGLVD